MHVLHVVGARPNFMKAAPVLSALARHASVRQTLVHTGQHYDANMSDIFFRELGLPEPDVNLGVGSGSHSKQMAEVMVRFEEVVLERKPDMVLVYGDVNSTAAAALVCAKVLIPLGHVEAGLRSFDRTMPEEVNRLVTDALADLLFTPSEDGNINLRAEGVKADKIHLVGNVMIDTLIRLLPRALERWGDLAATLKLDGAKPRYVLVTLHRPSNVDEPAALAALMQTLNDIAREIPVVFPVHPRTRQRLAQLPATDSRLLLIEPLGYLDFLALQCHATLVVTDSGGVQEETTYLRIPCITLRANTERPVTITTGSNVLVGQDTRRLRDEVTQRLAGGGRQGEIPPLWDGHAGERIADILVARK
ncbi:MAG TPA: UDP-N-acetylglucosamine 2-epimerase (non-hydrolyzing) [Gemmataceae bacterium]|nr:UDP-N-acetylglucosamine 2-epimerase (non-hydrolyzing) [Gemmataceae bacterium]